MRNYKLGGCFVDSDYRFALIHIYKNASISMRNALKMRGKYHDWLDVKGKDITTLCVIREPISRLISIYQYLLRLEDNGFIEKHPIHITKETEFYKNRDKPIDSFNDFLTYIEGGNFYDAVTLPQIEFLSDRGLTIDDIDEVFIQETLEDDFNRFSVKYGLNVGIAKDNMGNSDIGKLLGEYVKNNTEVQDQIRKLYKNDFNLYDKWLNK